MDLGVTEKDLSVPSPAGPSSKKEKAKPSYPSFDVREDKADEIRDERECEVGTEGVATIKFRLTGNNKDKYSNRLTFEVLDMDITSYGDNDEDDGAGEEKTLGYKRPTSEKEAPKMGAKDLE